METETISQRIERLQIKAEIFIRDNNKCFVRDIYNNYYFCFILFNGEETIRIQNFKGKRLSEGKEKEDILWCDVFDIKEYREERE
jgi:hypothetical protein